jgi:hypothetical protein
MSQIQNKLEKTGSPLSLNGKTPTTPNLQGSKLHSTYSIDGNPNIVGKPEPSQLDLDGKTPERYLDTFIGK